MSGSPNKHILCKSYHPVWRSSPDLLSMNESLANEPVFICTCNKFILLSKIELYRLISISKQLALCTAVKPAAAAIAVYSMDIFLLDRRIILQISSSLMTNTSCTSRPHHRAGISSCIPFLVSQSQCNSCPFAKEQEELTGLQFGCLLAW